MLLPFSIPCDTVKNVFKGITLVNFSKISLLLVKGIIAPDKSPKNKSKPDEILIHTVNVRIRDVKVNAKAIPNAHNKASKELKDNKLNPMFT